MKITRRDAGAFALLGVGLLAMVGDALGWLPLKGVGLATMASPLPKVFSAVKGYETFSARFTLLAELPDGGQWRKPLDSRVYRGLRGPYNRRNVYGAALSYAPRLPRAVWEGPFCHGLRPGGPLRAELGIPPAARRIRVLIESLTRGHEGEQWLLESPCTE